MSGLAALSILWATSAVGAPTDVFNGASPALDAKAPEPAKLDAGDWGVADQSGAATYTLPITVPPGRHGMAPSLALRYSSQGALRGGIAVGWSMDLPSIEVDRGSLSSGSLRFVASLRAASGTLIPVQEQTIATAGATAYRVDFDASYTRFERIDGATKECEFAACRAGWVAYTTDGTRHYFDEVLGASDPGRRWRITEEIDAFGNSISYQWATVNVDGKPRADRLAAIEYGTNAAAGSTSFARIELDYAPLETCSGSATPIGASLEYSAPVPGSNEGRYYRGASRLTAMRTLVKDTPSSSWRGVRTYTLGYDTAALACVQGDVPLRYLTRIDIQGTSADGVTTQAPPLTFDYGPKSRLFASTATAPTARPEHGDINGAASAWLDIDGDGVRDVASVGVSTSGRCELRWSKGRRGAGYGLLPDYDPQPAMTLPTGHWGGGQFPGANEGCYWTGQITRYHPSAPSPGCFDMGSQLGYRFTDWNRDGRVDLLMAAWTSGGYDPGSDPGLDGSAGFSPLTASFDDPGNPGCDGVEPRRPEKFVDYRLRLYFNDGYSISPSPVLLSSPFPLPPPGNSGELDASYLASTTLPVLFDLDGDGYQDILHTSDLPLGLPGSTLAYLRGTATGFDAVKSWPTPQFSAIDDPSGTYGSGTFEHWFSESTVTLRDVNGDGLADLLVESAARTYTFFGGSKSVSDRAQIAFLNTGAGFGAEPIVLGSTGSFEVTQTDVTEFIWMNGNPQAQDAVSGYRRRLADVNADGIPDRVVLSGSSTDVTLNGPGQVQYGTGDGFRPAVVLPVVDNRAKRLMRAIDFVWRVESDLADVDADGADDLVTWGASQGSALTEAPWNDPMRLLVAAHNGRGGTTRFSYAPSTDSGVVGQGGVLAGPRWVVASVTRDPGTDPTLAPATTTTYRYVGAVTARASGRVGASTGFRGFTFVTTTSPTGAQTVRRYSYDVPSGTTTSQFDGSGRVISVETWRREGDHLELHEVQTIDYGATPLLVDGNVAAIYPTVETTRRCAPGVTAGTANACRTQTTDLRRIVHTMQPRQPACSGFCLYAPQVVVETATEDSAALAVRDGDRRVTYEYDLRFAISGAPYQVLRTITDTQARDGGAWVTQARAQVAYSPKGAATTQTTWLDPAHAATTTRTFDAFGNPTTIVRPNHQATGLAIVLGYDAQHVMLTSTTNELGHVSTDTWDLGAGLRRTHAGPRVDSAGHHDNEGWTYDGLGRMTERRVGTGSAFTPTAVERVTYDDAVPNRITRLELIETTGTVWKQRRVELDGTGRVLHDARTTALGDAVTTYGYDNTGQAVTIDVPDPRFDDGRTVRSTYAYDSLGRLRASRRPDATGADVVFDRWSTTTTEVTSGVGGSKTVVRNVFDQVIEVHEHQAGAPDVVTQYRLDAAGRLLSVTDADGNLTRFGHDWAGRRLTIERGTRTWSYGYDLDGNVVSATSPRPAGTTAAAYTTTLAYDALDRVLTRTPATRGRTTAELDTLGAGPVAYTYDNAPYERGLLGTATVKRWGSTTPVVSIVYDYDAFGRTALQQWTVKATPTATAIVAKVARTYTVDGQLASANWFPFPMNRWRVDFDERGLPRQVSDSSSPLGAYRVLATFERALDGAPRRRTGLGGVQEVFTYDVLGHLRQQRIETTAGAPLVRAQVDTLYNGDGTLASMSGQSGGLPLAGSYEYDEIGRVIFAAGPTAQWWAYGYSPAGNVTDASFVDGGDQRELAYAYGARDPQGVDTLTSLEDGAAYAAYTYDLSGNVVERKTPDGTYQLVWDGEDRLRKVTGPAGEERYLYDPSGNRIARVDAAGVHAWLGEIEVFNATGSNVVTMRHVHISAGDTVARIDPGGVTELQFHDLMHHLLLATDPTGAVRAAFSYGPFGEVVGQIGGEDHRRQFNDKERDLRTGLLYYGARYYDPVTRRWIAGDPLYRFAPDADLLSPQKQNIYTFSRNNPIRYYDPDGREDDDLPVDLTLYKEERTWNKEGGKVAFTAKGTGVEATLTLAEKQYGDDDVNLVVKVGEASASIGCADLKCGGTFGITGIGVEGNVGPFSGGLQLALEFGGNIGAKTEVKTPLFKLGIDFTKIPLPEAKPITSDPDWLVEYRWQEAIGRMEADPINHPDLDASAKQCVSTVCEEAPADPSVCDPREATCQDPATDPPVSSL